MNYAVIPLFLLDNKSSTIGKQNDEAHHNMKTCAVYATPTKVITGPPRFHNGSLTVICLGAACALNVCTHTGDATAAAC